MKMLASIGFVAVIALSLIAGRAEAQLDSNARVTVICSEIVDGCTMTVFHVYDIGARLDTLGSAPSYQKWGLALNDTFRYIDGPRFGVTFSVDVDTVNRCFRNLSLYSTYAYGAEGQCANGGGWGGGTNNLNARLDVLNYQDSLGILSAHGVYAMSVDFSASYYCNVGISGHEAWNGTCKDRMQVVDTISIRIVPSSYLSVPPQGLMIETRDIAIRAQGTESLLCTFPLSEYPSVLKIYDFLGRTIEVVPIPISTAYLELPTASLSPGCYFARLGDQVAKFVVPPR